MNVFLSMIVLDDADRDLVVTSGIQAAVIDPEGKALVLTGAVRHVKGDPETVRQAIATEVERLVKQVEGEGCEDPEEPEYVQGIGEEA